MDVPLRRASLYQLLVSVKGPLIFGNSHMALPSIKLTNIHMYTIPRYTHTCMCIYTYIRSLYTPHMYIYTHTYIYIYMYIDVLVYLYTYIYIYIHMGTSRRRVWQPSCGRRPGRHLPASRSRSGADADFRTVGDEDSSASSIHRHIFTYVYTYLGTYVYMYIHIYAYRCIFPCIYVRICICKYIHVYT